MNDLQQAIAFCKKTNTSFECKYLRTGKYFASDTEDRDVYEITIQRGNRSYTTNFGNSIANSGKYIVKDRGTHRFFDRKDAIKFCHGSSIIENEDFKMPNEYTFLACVQKNDPGTFEDFCNEMGYTNRPLTEYPQVKEIYEGVLKEYNSIRCMYMDVELEELQEIQ